MIQLFIFLVFLTFPHYSFKNNNLAASTTEAQTDMKHTECLQILRKENKSRIEKASHAFQGMQGRLQTRKVYETLIVKSRT